MPTCQRCSGHVAEPTRRICRPCSRAQSRLMAAWCVFGMAATVLVAVAWQQLR